MIRTLLALLCMAAIAGAATLDETDFAGTTPFTFDGHALEWADQDVDFGLFSIAGFFDTYAYYMPITPPVVAPAIGSDTCTLTFHPPVERVGFHMGTQWTGIAIRFFGPGDVLLAEFDISDFAAYGTGPFGYNYQDFVGYQDDGGVFIERIEIGSGDHYIDNVYIGHGEVADEAVTWSSVKESFR